MYNDKKYKYWFFYIKPEYLHLVCTEESDSLLYAYTDNKEYAEIFKSQRDMNKFFIKKEKISKEEVNYLANNFMREYLIKKEINTKLKGIGSKIIKYDLILTKAEESCIQASACKILMVDIYTRAWTNPYIFDNEYLSILENIGYVDRFNMMSTWKFKNNKDINRIGENIQPDLLSTFIREYGFLLISPKGDK